MDKLRRDISRLEGKKFDLIIIGAGIFGAAAAWEASSRGLSVALIDKADFAHATSSNHFKIVHGGIRYLQHMDIPRIRESARERSALLRIAPHLVRPLPIVIPTYGRGAKGKTFLGTGMSVYELLTYDRNKSLQNNRRIPPGGFLSRTQILKAFPGIVSKNLTGGALFYDGQMTSPPRLVISFIRSAVGSGALACNYIEANGFIRTRDRISGIEATDTETGRKISIEGKMVLNTAGPWAHRLLESGLNIRMRPVPTFSRDLAFVVPRKFSHPMALAFATRSQDSDSIIDRGGRHLFAVPWGEKTLIGVWHKVYMGSPDNLVVHKSEIQNFIDEVNSGCPGLDLSLKEVSLINTGLTLFGDEDHQGRETMSFGKRSLLIDHEKEHGLKGLMSLIGVRATTARGMAEKAVNRIFANLDRTFIPSGTGRLPIFGGGGPDCQVQSEILRDHFGNYLHPKQINSLLSLYGSKSRLVLQYATRDPDHLRAIGPTTTLRAEVIHAVEAEMALHLEDVLFRRAELSTAALPSDDVLNECADIMSTLLGWDRATTATEISRVKSCFPDFNYKFRSEDSA